MHRSLGEVSHEPGEPLHILFLPPCGGLSSSDQNFALGFVLSVLPFRFCSLKFFCGIFRVALLFHCQCALIVSDEERRRRDLNPRAAINDLHPF